MYLFIIFLFMFFRRQLALRWTNTVCLFTFVCLWRNGIQFLNGFSNFEMNNTAHVITTAKTTHAVDSVNLTHIARRMDHAVYTVTTHSRKR